jgi:putative ABC transport system substrate-binding protein
MARACESAPSGAPGRATALRGGRIARRSILRLAASAAIALQARRAIAVGEPRIGWLKIQAAADSPGWLREFLRTLAGLGHAQGRTFELDERYADGDAARLPALADELVRSGARVIVATSQPAVDAARRTTSSVPIVGRMTDDPVENGYAQSLARPGGNVTGVYSLLEQMSPRRLALLQQVAPTIRTVGALLSLDRGATPRWLSETRDAAQRLGLAIYVMDVHGAGDLDDAFARAVAQRVDSVLVFRNPTVVTHAGHVIDLAARHLLPCIFDAREFVDAGGLLSYGPSLNAIFGRLAVMVDKILRGAGPSDTPIEQPTTLELVINARTAGALGLAIPAELLALADEVVG